MVGGMPAPSAALTPPAQKKLAWLTETLFATSKGKAQTAELEAALGLKPGDLQVLVLTLTLTLILTVTLTLNLTLALTCRCS